ncbi:MAG: transcription elongation factor GreA [Clostridia bacterium]|nr:transcription elongation factor GreA [Clostridia bacterium]MBR5265936.1 transcription elongation factor GreA [Clostridia bacterium]
MTMQKKFRMTLHKYEELKAELEYMKTVREKEVADQVKEARSFGDLSENSEYDEAKNEQGKLYSRIAEVENMLENHEIIEESDEVPEKVTTGCKVKIEDLEWGDIEEYYIVGSQEAKPMEGRISDESPFGIGMLGKKVGEIAVVEAPAGKQQYKILEISR